ncbi:MAG: sulfurtransferase [Steroidobacteraceae bacterium]
MDALIDCQTLAEPSPDGVARVIFDCRSDIARPAWGAQVYAQGHIPGAYFAEVNADLSGPRVPGSGRHPLPDTREFARWLGVHGVAPDTLVVAYDQGHGAFAARLWWLLRARGHERVRVLDGGFAAWTAASLPVTAETSAAANARSVVARPFAGWLSTTQVRRGLADCALLLVDARGADRYAGQNETIDPVAGHVPGAVSRPFLDNLDANGRFLSAAQLRAQWQALIDANPGGALATMCGSGITACHHLLALEVAGLGDGARLYAGSFSEWTADPERPVATGAAG